MSTTTGSSDPAPVPGSGPAVPQRRDVARHSMRRAASGLGAWRSGDVTAVLVVVAIAWVSWVAVNYPPTGGLDPSWMAGLQMATHQGLGYGRDVVFTYGPLGILSVSPVAWISSLAPWVVVYLLISRIAIAATLFLGARASLGATAWGTFAAAILAALLASLVTTLVETSILMAVAAWALRTRLRGRAAYALAVIVAIASAVELMNKISVGVAFALMSGVMLLALPQRRLSVFATGVVSGAVAFVVIWVGIGQPIGAIPDYIRYAIQIAGGYTPAMSVDAPPLDWTYTVFLAMLGAGLWAAWETTAGAGRRARVALIVVWLLFWFFDFKEAIGRTRADGFVEALIVAWVGFVAVGARRRDAWFRLAAPLALLVCALLAIEGGGSLTSRLTPAKSVSAAVKNLNTAFSPRLRGDAIALGHLNVARGEGIAPRIVQALHGHTVAVFPSETAVVWGYDLDWDPIPVFQSYAAYTPKLDRLDADFLRSDRAPQRILAQAATSLPAQSIDGRALAYDEPETTRTLLCRYRSIRRSGRWAVLARTADRCAPTTRSLFTVTARWGEEVVVPPPPTRNSIVFARVSGSAVHGAEALWSFLFKPGRRYVVLAPHQFFRFVSANEGDGLVLRAGRGYDLPGPFALVPQSDRLGISKVGQPRSGRPITIHFYAQTFRR